jgi:hypothetical protein
MERSTTLCGVTKMSLSAAVAGIHNSNVTSVTSHFAYCALCFVEIQQKLKFAGLIIFYERNCLVLSDDLKKNCSNCSIY